MSSSFILLGIIGSFIGIKMTFEFAVFVTDICSYSNSYLDVIKCFLCKNYLLGKMART